MKMLKCKKRLMRLVGISSIAVLLVIPIGNGTFHVLDDPQTVNAFALPGGQTFITTALLSELETTDQVAGVFRT